MTSLLQLVLVLPAIGQVQFDYATNDGTITITKCVGVGAVAIPENINGVPVIAIGNAAFWGCTNLSSLTIPKTVTSIGEYAFLGCAKLGEVALPNTITAIAAGAFSGCTRLSSVKIPHNVTGIGVGAFSGCTGLTNVTIPRGVISIENCAFYGSSLTSVTIPNSVTNIGDSAFHDCTSLAAITVDPLNPSYTTMAEVLFNKSLTTLIQWPGGKTGSYRIPNTVTNIECGAFADSSNLSGVAIPGSVTDIGRYAFSGCTGLSSITVPNSVTSIGDHAFAGCTGMTNATIPSSVTGLGYSAFYGCTRLTEITVDPLNPTSSTVDGVLFNKSQTTLIQCPGGKAGSYTVPGSVTDIQDFAFFGCTAMTNITIPDSVASIGYTAFRDCTSLTAITVDPLNPVYCSVDGVLFNKSRTTLIQCPGGKKGSYTIPKGVTTIGYCSFFGCTGLTTVTVPRSVTNIVYYAFSGCTNLKGVYFLGNAPLLSSYCFSNADLATVYYLPGTSGWGSTFGDRPTALWPPEIQASEPSFGVPVNRFEFTIAWPNDRVVVIEAAMDLNNSTWLPVKTNTLAGGSSVFSDPQWTNHTSRFYRIRIQ